MLAAAEGHADRCRFDPERHRVLDSIHARKHRRIGDIEAVDRAELGGGQVLVWLHRKHHHDDDAAVGERAHDGRALPREHLS